VLKRLSAARLYQRPSTVPSFLLPILPLLSILVALGLARPEAALSMTTMRQAPCLMITSCANVCCSPRAASYHALLQHTSYSAVRPTQCRCLATYLLLAVRIQQVQQGSTAQLSCSFSKPSVYPGRLLQVLSTVPFNTPHTAAFFSNPSLRSSSLIACFSRLPPVPLTSTAYRHRLGLTAAGIGPPQGQQRVTPGWIFWRKRRIMLACRYITTAVSSLRSHPRKSLPSHLHVFATAAFALFCSHLLVFARLLHGRACSSSRQSQLCSYFASRLAAYLSFASALRRIANSYRLYFISFPSPRSRYRSRSPQMLLYYT
jgi:hypothetical protein